MYGDLKVFTGNSNIPLAEKITVYLGLPVGKAEIGQFADGEIRVKIDENVRGCDVFVVQSTHPPAENILELLLLIDALKRASAGRITAVIPYFGYSRQDWKDEPRVPISAKLMADLIARAGADRVMTVDLHSEQIQGFFDIPVDHLFAAPVIIDHYQKHDLSNFVLLSPDVGAVRRTRGLAKRMGNLPLAIIDKRRPRPNVAEVVNIIGEIEGKEVIIYDDLIDTGGTMVNAARAAKDLGSRSIFCCGVHPLFSGEAKDRFNAAPIDEIVITDTINLPPDRRPEKLKILSISDLLAEAIKRVHQSKSISSLFREV
ncbi:MAG TPA: ribose-phosphate pyrophosphokinase [bacterium (Candidatus Stahlbacteria)]|nr:ribose-phosphate pyrophosphokinase [Candidatus Stahlbacteria bacterium]